MQRLEVSWCGTTPIVIIRRQRFKQLLSQVDVVVVYNFTLLWL